MTNINVNSNDGEDLSDTESHTNYDSDLGGSNALNDIKNEFNSANKLCKFLENRNMLLILSLYFNSGFVGDPTLNVYSLLLYTPRDEGGMGYTPLEYGQFKLYTALIVICIDLFFPILLLKIFSKRLCLSGSYLVLVLAIGMSWLPSRVSFKAYSFAWQLVLYVLCRIPISVIKVTQLLLLKNIFPKDTHSRVLGFSTFLGVAGNLVGYMITGVSFAWSLSNLRRGSEYSKFPFNEAFSFQLLSVFALGGAIAAMMLTDEAEGSETFNH